MHVRLRWLDALRLGILSLGIAMLVSAHASFAHIRVYPTESTHGAREKYTVRVPNEKQVATTRIEGDFPSEVAAYSFEFKTGWKIEFKKDENGKIVGATWTGRIAPYEFVEFGMLVINPKEGKTLVWRFVQHDEDGTAQEFTGPAGSPLPSPIVTLSKSSP